MKNIWITSDQHFFHKSILNWDRKDFKNVEEMNSFLINQWNSVVKENDIVYQLGDFAFGDDFEGIDNICKILNGKKTLLLGNHDSPKKIGIYINYFKIQSYHILKDKMIILSHIPLIIDRRNCNEEVAIIKNIHGHIHDVNFEIKDNRYRNVCWDKERKIYNLDELI